MTIPAMMIVVAVAGILRSGFRCWLFSVNWVPEGMSQRTEFEDRFFSRWPGFCRSPIVSGGNSVSCSMMPGPLTRVIIWTWRLSNPRRVGQDAPRRRRIQQYCRAQSAGRVSCNVARLQNSLRFSLSVVDAVGARLAGSSGWSELKLNAIDPHTE